jgi:hypothetical protein
MPTTQTKNAKSKDDRGLKKSVDERPACLWLRSP